MNEKTNDAWSEARREANRRNDRLAVAVINAIRYGAGPVTQEQLGECPSVVASWGKLVPERRQTRLRVIREVVRRARVEYGAPIMSGPSGYRVAASEDDVLTFVRRMETKAVERAISSFRTVARMRKVFGVPNGGGLASLFEEALIAAQAQPKERIETLAELFRSVRMENDLLRVRLAKWGRPPRRGRVLPGQGSLLP